MNVFKSISLCFAALMISACATARLPDNNVVAIQVCAMQSSSQEVVVTSISDGSHGIGHASSTVFKDPSDPLSERWESSAADGKRVASKWHSKEDFNVLLVDQKYIFIPSASISKSAWTPWMNPDQVTSDHGYAIKRAQGRDLPTPPFSSAEPVAYRVRYKQMTFDEFLSHGPKKDGPRDRWSRDPIPACDGMTPKGQLDIPGLLTMLAQDAAMTNSRPGSWEGANMQQVLDVHGYPYPCSIRA